MKKRIVMLLLSVVVIAGLVVVGCAPEVAPPPEEEAPPPEEEEEAPPPAAPEVEVIKWALQPYTPAADPDYPLLCDLCDRIELISGGRFKIHCHVEGELGSGWEPPYCVRDGIADMFYSGTYAMFGIIGPAALLIGSSGFPAGPTPREYVAWYYWGGGLELCDECFEGWGLNIGGVSGTTELFCHSNKKIETAKDLKGLKFRTYGLWAEILDGFGASVVTIAGPEIYSAAERGVIDAFEYCPPSVDWVMGFHEITKYLGIPGIHSPANPHLFTVNYDAWDKLPADLQMLLKDEIQKYAFDMLERAIYEDALAMEKYREYGTEIVYVSEELQREIARRSKEWCEKTAAEDPLFKKVFESQRDFFRIYHAQGEVVPRYSIYD